MIKKILLLFRALNRESQVKIATILFQEKKNIHPINSACRSFRSFLNIENSVLKLGPLLYRLLPVTFIDDLFYLLLNFHNSFSNSYQERLTSASFLLIDGIVPSVFRKVSEWKFLLVNVSYLL